MRSDLQKPRPVSDVTTDFKTTPATFKLPNDAKFHLTTNLNGFADVQ